MNKHFIKATEKFCSLHDPVPAPYLRRTFTLDYVPEAAELSVCGLGFYRLFVNGEELTRGLLAPYISNPDDLCYYDTYDVAGRLQKGKNVIALLLGNGMMNAYGGEVWDFDKAAWRGAPRVALSLEATAEGQEAFLLEADEAFRTHPSPIVWDDLRYGEEYDARLAIDGWAAIDFDDSAWQPALPAEAPRGELRLCRAEPIRTEKTLTPTSVIPSDGGYLYDFGLNTAGLCTLCVKNAAPGQRITFLFAEQEKDGRLLRDSSVFSLTGHPESHENSQKDIYICRGDAVEIWTPSFTYHGFRYVLVTGITAEQATPDLLTYHVMHSDMARHGGFSCSDETVNALFRNVQNADLSNFYYFPTDCPHREKNGWTGDAAASCPHMMLLYDCRSSYDEWLASIRKSQNEKGALPGIVPTGGWGFRWGNGPAWDRVAFDLPYECWRLRGDTDIVRDNMPTMMRYLTYILTRRSEDGTVAIGLGDWAPTGRSHSKPLTPLALTDSIMVMDMAKKAAEMFEAVGHTHEAQFARGIREDMRAAVRRSLLDADSCALGGNGGTQTGQAMGLYYGVFEPAEEARAFALLLDLIHANNDSFDCGYLGCSVIFHVLAAFGQRELAFRMITKKEYPSYGHYLVLGGTALPESFQPDEKFYGYDSRNHHFFGDIGRWFIREIAGLKVENDKTVVIAPAPVGGVTQAEAFYELPAGRVLVNWRLSDGAVHLTYACPDGVDCRVLAPDGYPLVTE